MRRIVLPSPVLRSLLRVLAALPALACEASPYEPVRPLDPHPMFLGPTAAERGVPARLRLRNGSDVDFDSIEVAWADPFDFGALPAQELGEYRNVSNLYGYAYVRALHGADEYLYLPIDYLSGPMPSGDYTYVLTVSPDVVPDPAATPPRNGWLQIEFLDDHILESSAPNGAEP